MNKQSHSGKNGIKKEFSEKRYYGDEMKITGSKSTWNLKYLISQYAERLMQDYSKKRNPLVFIEKTLIELIQKLPNGNYDQMIKDHEVE